MALVFPMPMGMNRKTVVWLLAGSRVPHAYGDEPQLVHFKFSNLRLN